MRRMGRNEKPFSHSDRKSASLFKNVVARTAQVAENKGRL